MDFGHGTILRSIYGHWPWQASWATGLQKIFLPLDLEVVQLRITSYTDLGTTLTAYRVWVAP